MSSGPKVINKNQSIVPFFGERMSFIRGLDPLGLQNTSDSTYQMILPGLNNVTGRIRYYSFYCWLLDEYSKRIGSTDPEIQRRFIRLSEYTIALISQIKEGNSGNIPGSNYAAKQHINGIKIHNLNEGIENADKTTRDTYWNFGWGAFGQYYLGSLRDIGLIINRNPDSNDSIYTRTNTIADELISGEKLAKAFDVNVLNTKELFFNCIQKEQINNDEILELLTEFNLTKIIPDSTEQILLSKLITQKDYPLRIEDEPCELRRITIINLLNFIKSEPEEFSDRQFIYSAYFAKGLVNNEINKSLYGWYYYQFNEFWQYANTSIFNGILDYLETNYGADWASISSLVDEIAQKVIDYLFEQKYLDSESDTLQTLISTLEADELKYFGSAKGNKQIQKIANSFLLIFSLYLNNYEEIVPLKEYSEINELAKDGEGTAYFISQFKVKIELSVMEFIREYIFKNIIYRHQYIAFRKMGGGDLSTQKFLLENHHIRYLGNFEATYTGPRLGSLISFFKDLKIIDTEYKLTEYGIKLHKELTQA